jgi:hypothetical protein
MMGRIASAQHKRVSVNPVIRVSPDARWPRFGNARFWRETDLGLTDRSDRFRCRRVPMSSGWMQSNYTLVKQVKPAASAGQLLASVELSSNRRALYPTLLALCLAQENAHRHSQIRTRMQA